MPDLTDFNTVPQVAAYLNIPERTLYDLIRTGKVGHVRLSERVIRITREHVRAWVAANTHEPQEARRG